MRRRHVRTLGKLKFGKRIEPHALVETLRQTLLIHGQRIHFDMLYLCLQAIQKIMVHTGIHIAKHNVGFGTFPGLKHLHPQIRAADSASDQCCIKYDCFHKSILGSPQSLVFFRLRHAPGGICPGINEKTFIIAVDKKSKHAGHNEIDNLLPLRLDIHFHMRNILF